MSADEHAPEPVPGLPEHLPPGETLLWQGRPEWKGLALHTFKVGWLAAYFALFAGLRLGYQLRAGQSLAHALSVVPWALACLALLCGLAWANARSTVYSITSRRVVMRFGVALPMTFNFPFAKLASADSRLRTERLGDIVLHLQGKPAVGWFPLWPHVQGWHFARPRPTLLSLADPRRVAVVLADAVSAWSKGAGAAVTVAPHEAPPVISVGQTHHARPPIATA